VIIVAIECARGGPVNRLVSSVPAVYLGKISYGTYLWHWPVILVTRALLPDITPVSTVAVAALLATALASLSYHMIERPIREQRFLDRVHPFVIATGLAVGVLAALVMVPRVLDPYSAHATTAQNATRTGFTPIPALDFQGARRTTGGGFKDVKFAANCLGKPVATCTILKGSGPHILLIGDSHAQMLQFTFVKIAQKQGLTMSMTTNGGCPWQRDLYLADRTAEEARLTRQCIAIKRDLYDRVIRQLKPDLVIAVSNDYLTRRPGAVFDRNNRPIPTKGPDDLRRLVKADTTRSLAALGRWAPHVLIVEPVPTTTVDKDPLVCLTKSKVLEDCRFVADLAPSPLALIYRDAADNKHVFVANFDKLLCPYMPICDPVIGGIIVRFDNQHITPKFAITLADPVTAFLQDAGLIPR
jgi:hypothetical protein